MRTTSNKNPYLRTRSAKFAYQGKKYSNPYFKTRSGRKSPKFNPLPFLDSAALIKAAIALSVFVLLSLSWFAIYSPFFKIQKINFSQDQSENRGQADAVVQSLLSERRFKIFPKNNIFFFSKKELAKRLTSELYFDNIKIDKDFPRTLILSFNERSAAMIWQAGDSYYFADKSGFLLNPIQNILEMGATQTYPIISSVENSQNPSRTESEQKKITFVFALDTALKEHNSEFHLDKYMLDEKMNMVKVELKEGPDLYFNPNEEIRKQIDKLIVVKNEKLKEEFNKKIYIDLRIADSVYYK